MDIALTARESLPTRGVCQALGLPHATLYRKLAHDRGVFNRKSPPKAPPSRTHHRALSAEERQAVRDVLLSTRFVDMAPAAVYATLLDEGRYLCSPRTMYRILKKNGEVRERRAQATHPKRTPPELVAIGPNQVWTWDITHLKTGVKGSTLKLYVCLDLYSRYVVGWYLSTTETSKEARRFFAALAKREQIKAGQLIIHGDNGGPMRGLPLADLLENLGIERSHSRPRTSNDNPQSESQFKTLKYRPTYPKYFESEDDARQWCREFFQWYNTEHRHEGLAMLTPADVYEGRAEAKLHKRGETLSAAYEQNPNRFVKGTPKPGKLPTEVAINPPPKPPQSQPIGATSNQEVTK